jgi:hypothetical protein
MDPEDPTEPTCPVNGRATVPSDAGESGGRPPLGLAVRWGARFFIREAGLILLGSLGFTLALCLTTPPLFEAVDFVLYHQANLEYLRQALLEFRLPLWNPSIGLGRPFLADVQNAVFYPLSYLVLCGPRLGSLLIVWLHAAIALAGMRALGNAWSMDRRVTWGVAFSFLLSLPLTGRLMAGQIFYVGALCYLPLLFWSTLQLARGGRRAVACHALFLALQFLCGHPQVFWFSALAQACFLNVRLLADPEARRLCAWTRANLRLAGAFLLCTGLVAAALLPFLELVGQGNRTASSPAFSDFGRLEWLDLMGLFGHPPYEQPLDWERNLFIGVLGVLAGLAGLLRWRDPDARALLGVGVLALVVSAGDQTPCFDAFYRGLPGFASFRVHARTATLITFVLLLASGLWLSRASPARRASWSLALAAGAVFLPTVIYRGRLTTMMGLPYSGWMAAAGLALLVCWLHNRDRRRALQGWILGALALLQAADLLNANFETKRLYSFLNVQRTTPDFPTRKYLAAVIEQSRSIWSDPWPTRVLIPRKRVPANLGMVDGYENVDAYTSLFLDRPWRFLHTVLELPEPRLKNTSIAGEIYDRDPFGHPLLAVDVGWDRERQVCLTNTSRIPRAFLAARVEAVTSRALLLERLRRGQDGWETALLEQPVELSPSGEPATGRDPQVRAWSPERIELVVRGSRPSLLVLAESWYPGWRARVDEREVESLPANGWMRAFRIPAGEHPVQVYYHQNYLALGLGISGLSLVVVGVLFAWERRGSPPSSRGPRTRTTAGA